MAELADAADSKSAEGNLVGVRPPLPAPKYVPEPLRYNFGTVTPQGAVPESRGDPRKNRFRDLESSHPQGGMADNREDVSHQARRRGLVAPQRRRDGARSLHPASHGRSHDRRSGSEAVPCRSCANKARHLPTRRCEALKNPYQASRQVLVSGAQPRAHRKVQRHAAGGRGSPQSDRQASAKGEQYSAPGSRLEVIKLRRNRPVSVLIRD